MLKIKRPTANTETTRRNPNDPEVINDATATSNNQTAINSPTTATTANPIQQSITSSVAAEDIEQQTRSDVIAALFEKLHERGIRSIFIFTDKNEGQIDTIVQVFGDEAVRLCLCHLMKAIKLRLAQPKHSNSFSFYDGEEVAHLFNFVGRSFLPGQDRSGKLCRVVSDRDAILDLMRKHYHMHTDISNRRR